MVLLRPALPGERFKLCACGAMGLCSPVRERSNFYPVRKKKGYRTECRRCSTRLARERYRKNPEQKRRVQRRAQARFKARHLERRRSQGRESAERRKASDPEGFSARGAAACRRYRKKMKEDPERREAALERDRMNYRLRRERREQMGQQARGEEGGRALQGAAPLNPPFNTSLAFHRRNRSGVRLPIEPFRAWIQARLEELSQRGVPNPVYALSRILHVSDKRLREWRFEHTTVDEAVVDHALSREGRYTLADVYPAPRVAYAAAMFWGARADVVLGVPSAVLILKYEECARPGCPAERNGGRFCHEHTEELARIREELEAESALMASNGGAARRQSKQRRAARPVCCNPDCWHSRVRGERFCTDCRAEGWAEDDDGIVLEEVGV